MKTVLGISSALTVLMASSAGEVFAQNLNVAAIPGEVTPPAGAVLHLTTKAKGYQIYVCQAKANNPKQFEWSLKGPIATLYDELNRPIGTHAGGPSWQLIDSSRIEAKPVTRINSPDGAIPWVLLSVTEHSGKGALTEVSSIQRVGTIAGKPPAPTCDAQQAGQEFPSYYEAVYHFYRAGKPTAYGTPKQR
jgi:hypothetical protein